MSAFEVEREGNDIRAEDMIIAPEEPGEIQKFYEGATVFITGSSGFLGKVIVEKLLRTCNKLKKIYLLLRPKKGKNPSARFDELYSDILYNRLRVEQPNFIHKLCIVEGDLAAPKLGLSPQDYETLVNEVDIVLHVAATVRFDEKIRVACGINVQGTKEILHLGKLMKNLRAFVHVSTAYSNCPRKDIDEVIYDPPISAEKLINIVEMLDDKQLEAITPSLLQDWPNTYVYTKAIAEELVKQYADSLPIAMVRPSIVISTAKEPVAGWTDNLYGATGIAVGAAVGLLRTLHCDPKNVADLVPVDHVTNTIIAASWNVGHERTNNKQLSEEKKDSVEIYNYVGSVEAPLIWRDYMKLIEVNAFKVPSPVTVWHYCFYLNPNYYVHMLAVYLLHFLPALIVDAACIVLRKKPRLFKGYQKINKFATVISYFSSRQWRFKNDNVKKLWKKLGPQDKTQFDFDMSALKWEEYFYSYVRGMRVYLLKDPLETVPQGRVKFLKLKIAHYFLVSIIFLAIFKLFMTIVTAIFG